MNIAMTVVLIVVFALMLIMPYFTQKKKNKEYMDMLSSIKVGDLVKTAGGIIGKVNKITDKGEVKTFVLETGSKTQKSYLEMDMTMIYCVLNKTTKPADGEEKTEENAETADKQEAEAEISANAEAQTAEETKSEEAKTEETENKPAKKTTARRTSTKTSTRTSAKTSKSTKK